MIVRQMLIELLVLLIRDVILRTRPQRAGLIDGLVFVLRDHFALFSVPFLFVHQDGQGDMVRVLLDDRLQTVRRQQFVFLGAQMQRDSRAALGAVNRFHGEITLARAFPAHAFSRRQTGAARFNRDLVRDDKARIKAHAELADQRRVFLLVAGQLAEKFLGARARDRAEVRNRLVAAHANAVVVDRDGARDLVVRDANPQIGIGFVQRVVFDRFEAQLVGGVRSIRDQLTQEDFLVAVQRMDHQLQKLFHFCLKAHGFLCHGQISSLFVAIDSSRAWPWRDDCSGHPHWTPLHRTQTPATARIRA